MAQKENQWKILGVLKEEFSQLQLESQKKGFGYKKFSH